MGYVSYAEDFAAEGTSSKNWPTPSGRITPAFNLALFAFVSLKGLLLFLFTAGAAGRVPLEGLILTSVLDLIRYSVVLLITAGFLRVFWHRLIAPLLSIRLIDYNESIAIILMIAIIFGG